MLRAREVSFIWILIFHSLQLHPDDWMTSQGLYFIAQSDSIATHKCMEDTNTQFKPLCMVIPNSQNAGPPPTWLPSNHPSVTVCFLCFLDNLPKVPLLDLMSSQTLRFPRKWQRGCPVFAVTCLSASTKSVATKGKEMYSPFHDDVLRVHPNVSPQTIIKWMNKEMSFTKWHHTLKW